MTNPDPSKDLEPDLTTDDAWKVFGLVNDWIRHADNKIGLTLAASGAVGVMLYNLSKALPQNASGCAYIAPSLCGISLFLTVALCTHALNPRIDAADSVENLSTLTVSNRLYFGDIATKWKRERYACELAGLAADPAALLNEIAIQIHVNAKIATQKMTATKRAVYTLSFAVAALAATAIVVLFHS